MIRQFFKENYPYLLGAIIGLWLVNKSNERKERNTQNAIWHEATH